MRKAPDEGAGAPEARRWLAINLVALLLSAWGGVLSLIPPEADVLRAELILTTGSLIPPSPETVAGGRSHLAGTLFLRIGSRVKGQRIKIEEVRFYDSSGKMVASSPVTFLNRQIRTELPGSSDPGRFVETSKPVQGDLFLWPLEGATLHFPVVTSGDLGLGRGDQVRVEVRGRSGMKKFRVGSKPTSILSEA